MLMAMTLVFGGAARAATAPPRPAPIPLASGAFFALSVADIEASANWYRDKLGLEVLLHPPRSGPAEVRVLEGGGLLVELIQHDEAVAPAKLRPPVTDVINLHGIFKVGVMVEDIDQALATLRARGIPIAYGPYAANDGVPANFIINDNAGNLIQFFAGKAAAR
jgi:catechol 2,3-dioxygenase-like lactoylglutathione lyase family enzyme